jgi:predicted phosphoribosyltransferase
MRPDESMRFANRQEAGRDLGDEVARYLKDQGTVDRPLVLGMSRGGVPVAVEVARAINGELDVIVVMNIGVPWRPDFSVGAVAENGPSVIDHDALTRANLSVDDLGPVVAQQRRDMARLAEVYRDGREAQSVSGRVVVVVDDGMQTGIRARAALRALHAGLPAHLVFATPVCAAETMDRLAAEADGLIHVRCPCCFTSTGLWYREIHDLTDAQVVEELRDVGTAVPTPV